MLSAYGYSVLRKRKLEMVTTHGVVKKIRRIEDTLLVSHWNGLRSLRYCKWPWLADIVKNYILTSMANQVCVLLKLNTVTPEDISLAQRMWGQTELACTLLSCADESLNTLLFLTDVSGLLLSEPKIFEKTYKKWSCKFFWTYEYVSLHISNALSNSNNNRWPCITLEIKDIRKEKADKIEDLSNLETPSMFAPDMIANVAQKILYQLNGTTRTPLLRDLYNKILLLKLDQHLPIITPDDDVLPIATSPPHPAIVGPATFNDSRFDEGKYFEEMLYKIEDTNTELTQNLQRCNQTQDNDQLLWAMATTSEYIMICSLHALKTLNSNAPEEDKVEEMARIQKMLAIEQLPKLKSVSVDVDKNKRKKESINRKNYKETESQNKFVNVSESPTETNVSLNENNSRGVDRESPISNTKLGNRLHLKMSIYTKLCWAYIILFQFNYSKKCYGAALKYLKLANACQKLVENTTKRRYFENDYILTKLGDIYWQVHRNACSVALKTFEEQFKSNNEIDKNLIPEIKRDILEQNIEILEDWIDVDANIPIYVDEALLLSYAYHQRAVSVSKRKDEIIPHLMEIVNDITHYLLIKIQNVSYRYSLEKAAGSRKELCFLMQCNTISRKYWDFLEEAMRIFKQWGTKCDVAIMLCFKGHYMKVKAFCRKIAFEGKHEDYYYNQAIKFFEKAMRVIGQREKCESKLVWDGLAWDVSNHIYERIRTVADKKDFDKTKEAFERALKYCFLSPGPHEQLYRHRAAELYHRLFSSYQNQYNKLKGEDKNNSLVPAIKDSFEKAAELYTSIGREDLCFKLHLQYITTYWVHANEPSELELVPLTASFGIMRKCRQSIAAIMKRKGEKRGKNKRMNEEDCMDIEPEDLSTYVNGMQNVLKRIVQHYVRLSKSNDAVKPLFQMYKKLYATSLRIRKDEDLKKYASNICEELTVIEEIHEVYMKETNLTHYSTI